MPNKIKLWAGFESGASRKQPRCHQTCSVLRKCWRTICNRWPAHTSMNSSASEPRASTNLVLESENLSSRSDLGCSITGESILVMLCDWRACIACSIVSSISTSGCNPLGYHNKLVFLDLLRFALIDVGHTTGPVLLLGHHQDTHYLCS